MKWEQGRHKSGYFKKLLCTGKFPLPFDMYLLKFTEGSEIKTHVDEVSKGKHFRLNIILKKAVHGGEFLCDDAIIELGRVKLFRPDISLHRVTKVIKGTRYVLSIGWIKS